MIGRTGTHAIRALVVLAGLPPGQWAAAGEVARRIAAPPNYLGKLLQQMTRRRLVSSRKGLGGGFRLGRDPAEITLHDIIDTLEDVGRWSGCFLGHPTCSDDSPCAVHDQWGVLRDSYLRLLSRTTLADLMRHGEGRPAIPAGLQPGGDRQ